MRSPIHFIPLATSVLALAFAVVLLRRWTARRPAPHLLWWAIGMLAYGAGTVCESLTTLFGWQEGLFRAWYITGALLGAAPMAQGSTYLHLSRRAATRWAVAVSAVIVAGAAAVLATPIDASRVQPYRLSGAVMTWQWARGFSPLVNLYAVTFLVGGAVLSALRFRRDPALRGRFVGNVLIAVGGILPGIGGAATRAGHVEVLYVTEFVGLVLIWLGFRAATRAPAPAGPATPAAPHAGADTGDRGHARARAAAGVPGGRSA